MAKAVTEVAIGAAAIGLAVAMPGIGMALDWMTAGMQASIIGALSSVGGSMVLSGVADALKGNQGGLAVGVTTPIGPWGYIYGTQKVGGVEIFRESNNSQGVSNDKQLHRVYALGCHPCVVDAGSWQLRIDGKQVLMAPYSAGYGYSSYSPTQTTVNISSISRTDGVVTMKLVSNLSNQDGLTLQMINIVDNTFNGTFTVTQPDPTDATTLTYICGGSDATTSGGYAKTTYSDYRDKIYVEFLDGNHTSTFRGLIASGTSWSTSDLCLGRTLVYVRMGYDESVFPSSIPNVSFVIEGKNDILDPRTGSRGYTNNPALAIADFLSTPRLRGGFGLTIGTDIPTTALISAANICDETVALAAGGTTKRYTCDTFVQLNTSRGTILKNLLSSCSGRLTYQGGQYSIFPGTWVSPTLQLTEGDIVGPIDWHPRLSIRDTCNAVKGTYVSPENAYQQADVPAYMQDADHGFVTDPWLAEDRGERIFKEANFPCTNSSAIAQRLEKIALMRTRYQGRGTFQFNLKAYQAVALDVIQLSHPRYNWVNKNFEVLSSRFKVDYGSKVPRPYIELDLAETDSTIYDWEITEQLTPQGYKQPNNVGVRICAPPEAVSIYSGPGETVNGIVYPSTINITSSGIATNSIYVRWTQPNDANVVSGGHLEVQWEPVGASAWNSLANISPTASSCFITGVTDGAQYNVRIRAVNCAGVPSSWVNSGPVTISNSISSLAYSGVSVASDGTLSAQGLSDGTAQISVIPFTAKVGTASVSCTPDPSILTGLNQSQLYYVYYVDDGFVGGSITPVATQIVSDFEDKAGYFLIGSIVTPSYTPRYQPSTYADLGSNTTITPAAAYDNNVSTSAQVSSTWSQHGRDGGDWAYQTDSSGICVWSGFTATTLTAAATLHCLLRADDNSFGATWSAHVSVTIAGTATELASFTGASAGAYYTMSIPAGTDLSTVSVRVSVLNDPPSSTAGGGSSTISVAEIYIQ